MSTVTFEFDSAIAAHKTWLKHLEFVIAGIEEEEGRLRLIGDYRACPLGHWLEEEGSRFSSMRNFAHLVEAHRLFHELAAKVVELVHAGKGDDAIKLLEGKVADLSVEISLLLEAMKREFHSS